MYIPEPIVIGVVIGVIVLLFFRSGPTLTADQIKLGVEDALSAWTDKLESKYRYYRNEHRDPRDQIPQLPLLAILQPPSIDSDDIQYALEYALKEVAKKTRPSPD